MTNPVLYRESLPLFDRIEPDHISPAIESILNEANTLIHSLKKMSIPTSWGNFVEPIEIISEKISRAWGQIEHLNAVVNSDSLRKAYNDNLIKLTEFYTNLSQDESLYKKYQSLKDSEVFKALTPSQKRIIDNVLREFKLGGAELNETDKKRFKVIQEKLAKLSTQFEENILAIKKKLRNDLKPILKSDERVNQALKIEREFLKTLRGEMMRRKGFRT